MAAKPKKTLKLVYCYAHKDKTLRDELDIHLSNLNRQNHITSWADREIEAGMEWKKKIDAKIDAADIILLLVSPDFMASEYCYHVEMKRAIERHEAGTARVLPIILRPVDWEDAPFSRLQVLPTGAKPITLWQDRDVAFRDVAKGIRNVVNVLQGQLEIKNEKDSIDSRELEIIDIGFTHEAELDITVRNLSNNAIIIKQITILVTGEYGVVVPLLRPTARYKLPINDLRIGQSRSIRVSHYIDAHRADRFLVALNTTRALRIRLTLHYNKDDIVSFDTSIWIRDEYLDEGLLDR